MKPGDLIKWVWTDGSIDEVDSCAYSRILKRDVNIKNDRIALLFHVDDTKYSWLSDGEVHTMNFCDHLYTFPKSL